MNTSERNVIFTDRWYEIKNFQYICKECSQVTLFCTIRWNVICIDMSDFEQLNDINQRIWEQGFTCGNLKDLETLSEDIKNGAAVFERIPYAQQSGLSKGSEVLCAASIICRGCPRTESETRQIYDTDDLVGEGRIQEYLVETWARLSGKWIDEPELFLEELCQLQDRGTESEVYFDVNHHLVYKLISLKHYNILRLALDRVIIHNALFPETALTVIGFARNRSNAIVIVVKQPYVSGESINPDERVSFMYDMGFLDAGMDYGMHLNYKTDSLYVGDLNEFNVLKGEYGYHVIDADCRLNVPELECGGSYIVPSPGIDFSRPFDAWKTFI